MILAALFVAWGLLGVGSRVLGFLNGAASDAEFSLVEGGRSGEDISLYHLKGG